MNPPEIKKPRFSMWSHPKSILADYQHSSKLPDQATVVIVGSGFSGASIAYHLLNERPGVDVVMIEGREACSGASGRNGGHLAPNYLSPDYAFEKLNFDELFKLIQQHDLTDQVMVHGDKAINGYYIYETDAQFNAAKAALGELSRHGVVENAVRVIEDSELVYQELGVSRTWPIRGAIAAPCSPINPYRLTNFLLKKCVLKGLKLYTHTMVTSIDTKHGKSTLTTDKGVLSTDTVVMATNAYTGSLSSVLNQQIYPVRGQVARWVLPRACVNNLTKTSIAIGSDEYMAIVPDQGDQVSVIFGGLRRYEPDGEVGLVDDSAVSHTIQTGLRQKFGQIWQVGRAEPVEEWSGIMGFSNSGAPLVGELTRGVLVMAGFGGHGMPRIFLSGKALVHRHLTDKVDAQWPDWFPSNYRYL